MLSNNNSDTYTHRETCSNCGQMRVYSIQKGTTVSSYMQHKTCDNCGCKVKNTGSFYPYHAQVGGALAKDPDIRYVMGVSKSPIGESRATLQ